jgi:hypothetical protein
MRVFVSHQKRDAELAAAVTQRLRAVHAIDCYLDLIDPDATSTGDELGEYLRRQLSACTQLMAVVSVNTKDSWWVPWEIGIATEKDYPISTYAGDQTTLPSYLKKWPYLRSSGELDIYAREAKKAEQQLTIRKYQLNESQARRATTSEFHKGLRTALGQY